MSRFKTCNYSICFFIWFRIECTRVWNYSIQFAITNGLWILQLFFSWTRKIYLPKKLRNHLSQHASLNTWVSYFITSLVMAYGKLRALARLWNGSFWSFFWAICPFSSGWIAKFLFFQSSLMDFIAWFKVFSFFVCFQFLKF